MQFKSHFLKETIIKIIRFLFKKHNEKKIIFYLKNLRANFASLIYKTFSIKPKLSIFFKIYKSDKYEQYANNYDTIFATLDRKKN